MEVSLESTVAVNAPFCTKLCEGRLHRCTQRNGDVLGSAFRNHCRPGVTPAWEIQIGRAGLAHCCRGISLLSQSC